MVSDEGIEEIMNRELSLDETAKILIDQANANGGKDNITLILVKVEE
jgi:protein phosphatase